MALGNNLTKTQIIDSGEIHQSSDNIDTRSGDVEGVNILSEILESQKASLSDSDEIDDPTALYITLNVAEEIYTIPINLINEVVPFPDITLLPQVPNYILGMVNVRGEIHTVLDLGLKHNLRKAEDSFSPNFLITIKSDFYKIALAMEQLPLTIIVKNSEISSTGNLVNDETGKNHVTGIIKKENDMLMCIDIDNLVDDLKL